MARLKTTRAREIIRQLNRMDLSVAEYRYVKNLVEGFIEQFVCQAFSLVPGQRLYREERGQVLHFAVN